MQSVIKTINLPKKDIRSVNMNTLKKNILHQYEIQPALNCFDPNITGSPPNNFVELLNQRITNYYSSFPCSNKNE